MLSIPEWIAILIRTHLKFQKLPFLPVDGSSYCKELVKSESILLTDTADRFLRKLRVVSADDWFLRTHRDTTDRVKPWIELKYFRTRYVEYLLLVSYYLFRVRKARVSTSI